MKKCLPLIFLLLLMQTVAAQPALAVDYACESKVGKFDTSSYPQVRISFVRCSQDEAVDIQVKENGREVHNLTLHSGKLGQDEPNPRNEIMLLIDTSQSMQGERFEAAKEAAKTLLLQAGPTDKIGLVTFDGKVRTIQAPTSDLYQLSGKIDQLQLYQGTRIFDAVDHASSVFSEDATRKMMILLTDGSDSSSKVSAAAALSKAQQAKAEIYSVGLQSTSVRHIKVFAAQTGGSFQNVLELEDLGKTYAQLGQELLRGYWVEYESFQPSKSRVSVAASLDGDTLQGFSYMSPSKKVSAAKKDNAPAPIVEEKIAPPKLYHEWMGFAAALLVGLAVFVLVQTWFEKKRVAHLKERLETAPVKPSVGETDEAKDKKPLEGLYAMTENILGKSNLFKRFHKLLEQGNIPLRPVELLYLMAAGGLIGGLLFLMTTSIFGLAFIGLGAFAPYLWVKLKVKKRKKAFEMQLSDALGMIASSLKAGHSFNQSMAAVAKEAANPMAEELKRVMTESRLGVPLEDALQDMATRMDSADFDFAVTTVNIQRTVGGSLSDILQMVADTVRKRQQFRKKVKALTSMGSMSAYVLLGMPVVMAGVLTLMNKTYIMPLFTTQAGHYMLMAGAFFMLLGYLSCKKIVSIKT